MPRRSDRGLVPAMLAAGLVAGWFAGPLGPPAEAAQAPQEETTMTQARSVDSLRGKTIRWTFENGPMPGTPFEHVFHEDGRVTWRIADGPAKGTSGTEKACSVVRITQKVHVISYLGASGHTLTVVLDFSSGRAFGFASNEKERHALTGTFAVVD